MTKKITSVIISIMILVSMLSCLSQISMSTANAATTSQLNMVKRADSLYNMTWTAKANVNGWRNQSTFTKGGTYRIPYGQPVSAGKYIGYNVSFVDFLSSTTNASSVFYTSRSYYNGWYSTYYANDCSAFVSYCWGLARNTTSTLGNRATSYGYANSNNVDKIQIGDALNYAGSHVVLVTDVTYNGSTLSTIEITEQTPPQLKRTTLTRSGLISKYGSSYVILRYSGTVSAPTFTFNYNANGGTGTMANQTIIYDTATALSKNQFTRDGYTFAGWVAYRNPTKTYYYTNGTNYGWYEKGKQPSGYSMAIYVDGGTISRTGYGVGDTVTMYALWQNSDGVIEYPSGGTSSGSQYFPACDSSYTSLTEALTSIGVDSSKDYRTTIAEANGISDYTGTAEQNTTLLTLLKNGKLINPEYEPPEKYFPACDSSYTSLTEALTSIGVDSSKAYRTEIAAANGISDYTGTAEQNTTLLGLLKDGLLIDPSYTEPTTTPTTQPTTAPTTQPTTAPTTPTTPPTTEPPEDTGDVYYPACDSSYTSFTEALTSIGVDSSKAYRTQIALANGISDYTGTAEQNTTLLGLLKRGKLIKVGAVVDPWAGTSALDIGTDFNAYVYSVTSWKMVTPDTDNNAILNDRKGDSSQLLSFVKNTDGSYKISTEDGLCLTVADGSSSAGANVTFAADNGSNSQKWNIYGQDGEYRLRALCATSCYLEVTSNGTTDRTNICSDTPSVGTEQDFQILEYTGTDYFNGYDNGYVGGAEGDGKIYAEGIDVSKWNGENFDFEAVKAAGIDYVIIRAGSTNAGLDPLFEEHYAGARAAGLDVGAYFYTYATDTATARADAKKFLSYIEGKTFEYPVYVDYEDPSQVGLSKELSKSICLTFMTMMANEGYLTGVYSGSQLTANMNMEDICERYEMWFPHYYDGTYESLTDTYSKLYGMYQYTDAYTVGSATMDANVCYKDYPSIVKKYGFNGYEGEVDNSPKDYESGDVNQDGKLDINDVTYIQRYLVNLIDFTEPQLELADYDGNGSINIKDVTKIQLKLVGVV